MDTAQTPTRACLYYRASGGADDSTVTGSELRDAVTRRGWSVVAETEAWVPATSKPTPMLEPLLGGVPESEVEVVVIDRLQTIASSVRQLASLLDALGRARVALISLADDIDTTKPDSVSRLVEVLADFETKIAADSARAGAERTRARGSRPGRPLADIPMDDATTMMAKGLTLRETARRLGVSPSTLSRRLRECVTPR